MGPCLSPNDQNINMLSYVPRKCSCKVPKIKTHIFTKKRQFPPCPYVIISTIFPKLLDVFFVYCVNGDTFS